MAYLVPWEPDAGTRCSYLKGLKGLSCPRCRHYVTMIAYSFNEATHTAVVCGRANSRHLSGNFFKGEVLEITGLGADSPEVRNLWKSLPTGLFGLSDIVC